MKIIKEMKLADVVTTMNLVCGVISIFLSISQRFMWAAIFMLISVLSDFLDGKVARYFKVNNEFGKQLDSLADVVSFGVTPAVFAYSMGYNDIASTVVLMFFVICGLLRLARFNVMNVKYFIGMPITMNGIIFPIAYFAGMGNVMILIYLVAGFLMISDFKIKKIL